MTVQLKSGAKHVCTGSYMKVTDEISDVYRAISGKWRHKNISNCRAKAGYFLLPTRLCLWKSFRYQQVLFRIQIYVTKHLSLHFCVPFCAPFRGTLPQGSLRCGLIQAPTNCRAGRTGEEMWGEQNHALGEKEHPEGRGHKDKGEQDPQKPAGREKAI